MREIFVTLWHQIWWRISGATRAARKTTIIVSFLTAACLNLAPSFGFQEAETPQVRRVMVVRDDVNFRVKGKQIGPAPLGMILDVSSANGSWLWFEGPGGYLKETDVADYDKAIDFFSAAIERNPTSSAFQRRGFAHAAMGNLEQGVDDFTAAIERDAENVSALNERGNVLRQLDRLDEALADFNSLIERGIQHPAVFTNRGLVFHEQGGQDRALEDFNSAIKLDAQFAPAWESAGAAREALGDYTKAISNYQKALELNANFDRAHNNLAWILATNANAGIRDPARALRHAERACELTGYQDPTYIDTLAAAHAASGDFEQAVKRAEEAIEKAPADQAIENRLELYKKGQPYTASDEPQTP